MAVESDNIDEVTRWQRYARQMVLPGFGLEGQQRLSRSRVLLLGAGGLGSVCSQYLVRAGVGRLMIIDRGKVDLPDLNRQLLYTTEDVGKPKALVAEQLLRNINSEVETVGIYEEIDQDSLREYVGEADIVIDALDNFPARLAANRECWRQGKLLVHGGVLGLRGIATVVAPGKGPCLQCIYEAHDLTPPESPFPVLGPTPGVIGCIQAMETLNILVGAAPSLVGRLILFNGESMNFSYRKVNQNSDCPVCRETDSTSDYGGGSER
ncbi:MAG: HesA/MoeB/ThiF family protein [Desulfomonilaceae bacterium]